MCSIYEHFMSINSLQITFIMFENVLHQHYIIVEYVAFSICTCIYSILFYRLFVSFSFIYSMLYCKFHRSFMLITFILQHCYYLLLCTISYSVESRSGFRLSTALPRHRISTSPTTAPIPLFLLLPPLPPIPPRLRWRIIWYSTTRLPSVVAVLRSRRALPSTRPRLSRPLPITRQDQRVFTAIDP